MLMKIFVLSLIQTLFLGSAFAAQTLSYPGGTWISLETHCYEKGYIRPRNPVFTYCEKEQRNGSCKDSDTRTRFLKKPILEIERIDLGKRRIFTRAQIFNLNRLKKDDGSPFQIPNCDHSMIENANPVVIERKGTSQEKLVYGALWQSGIQIIDSEGFKIEDIELRLQDDRGGGRDKLEKSIPGGLNLDYRSPNCEDGEVVERDWTEFYKGGEGSGNGFFADGGEGSGNGRYVWGNEDLSSGRVVVNLKVSSEVFRTLSPVPSRVERWLGMNSRYSAIVNGDIPVPTNVARTRCR